MMSVTLIIILATIAASFYAWSREDIYEKWMMYPYRIKRNKEYLRFITSGFIHSGYGHLAFNMLSLYFFASAVEFVMTPIVFIIFYIIAIVVSDISTYLKQKNNPGYRSLGASGAVSAVIFSSILINPNNDIYLFFIPINGVVYGLLFLIYSYYQAKNSSDNIGHEAHFYGALFGIVFTVAMFPQFITSFIEFLLAGKFF